MNPYSRIVNLLTESNKARRAITRPKTKAYKEAEKRKVARSRTVDNIFAGHAESLNTARRKQFPNATATGPDTKAYSTSRVNTRVPRRGGSYEPGDIRNSKVITAHMRKEKIAGPKGTLPG